MRFNEAFRLMKMGQKIMRPFWGGYWFWDKEKQTIMMKLREADSATGKDLMDIRETQRVEFTVENMLAEDWQIAEAHNCPAIRLSDHLFSFGQAIEHLKRGMKLTRKGWNGKNQYIELAKGISYETSSGDIVNSEHAAIGNNAIAFVGTSGVQMGWLASQADMLAEDWTFSEYPA